MNCAIPSMNALMADVPRAAWTTLNWAIELSAIRPAPVESIVRKAALTSVALPLLYATIS